MREPTYTVFAVHSLLPASGWHAVHYDDHGRHLLIPVHLLALVNRRTYTSATRQCVPAPDNSPEEECREVVGMDYAPVEGFQICDYADNYCGLLPPDWTLEAFTEAMGCGHGVPVEQET